ncbi:MAG: triphosphoribosyl-dephospho-CoA synthetase [Acidobacteria bacterium]|nr:triphosphoribosyl-dephospho-CoA synthetase [Acidobacteriota bacterium]
MTHVQAGDVAQSLVSSTDVMVAAQLACLLEVSAPKPGNVSPGRHFSDTRYEDFLASAAALGAPLANAAGQSLGLTVRLAIEATRRWVSGNTNLGIVLLLAPLARAALRDSGARESGLVESRIPNPESLAPDRLRAALRQVLDETTTEDARDVYAAIRMASPGGLGDAETQDVAGEPDVTLLEAMRLAAHRDGIAREYETAFEVTFGIGVPALQHARADGLPWDDAVVETFLTMLAANIDTHVVRRAGVAVAANVLERARYVIGCGGVRTEAGRRALEEMDRAIRDTGNAGNPGTTADLTAAAIFVFVLCGGWSRERDAERVRREKR